MKQSIRTSLFLSAAILMLFAALMNAAIVVPHLRQDMIEISVRPTLLAAILLALSFGTFAMFGFALLVLAAAFGAMRGAKQARLSLSIVAFTYTAFGIMAFAWSRSPHTLGYLVMGLLLGIAIAIPTSQ